MIFKGERTCDNCLHKEVCSLKNDFKDFTQKANELVDSNNLLCFDFVISCKEFRQDVAVRTPFRN